MTSSFSSKGSRRNRQNTGLLRTVTKMTKYTYITKTFTDSSGVRHYVRGKTLEQTASSDQKPALSQEEVQRRIARIRKRKKRLEAELKKRDKHVQELVRRGYDFFKAEEDRYLDPER